MKIEPEHRRLIPAYPALASLAATLLAATSCSAQQAPQRTSGQFAPPNRPESAADAVRPKQIVKGRRQPRPQQSAETNRRPHNLRGGIKPRPKPAPQDPPKKP